MNVLIGTVGYHHLVDCREVSGQQSFLPVAVETEHRAHITDVRKLSVVVVVNQEGELPRTETHACRFVHQHHPCGLFTVAHIQRQLYPGESQRLPVNIESPMEQGIVCHGPWLDADDILLAVGYHNRLLHLHLIHIQVLLVEQEVEVLHQVEHDSLYRTADYLHCQRITLARTHQSAPFGNSYPISPWSVAVRRFVHIRNGFGDVDVVLPFLCHLTIETLVERRLTTVVFGNPADGFVHNILRIACAHNHFI